MHVRLKQPKGRNNVPEFQPGPKGNSHEKTVRMMGDWADSSSSFSALSCCIGAHPWISASCRHSSSTLWTSGAAARAAPPARAYLRSFALSHVRPFIQSARESTHTDTTKGVFSDTIDVPTESVAASATRSSVRRQERRLDMVVDGGKRDWQWGYGRYA